MLCNHCGNEIEVDSKYCRFCGKPYKNKIRKEKRKANTFRNEFPEGKWGPVLFYSTIILIALVMLGILGGIIWLIYEFGAIIFFLVVCGVGWLGAALRSG